MKPNDTLATLDVNRFGTFTANLKAVPPQYWIPLYGLIGSTIVGWSLPTIIASITARIKRKESVEVYEDIINSVPICTLKVSIKEIMIVVVLSTR